MKNMKTCEKELEEISKLARRIVQECTKRGMTVATAESCTGGMLSAALTAVPGSSAVISLGVCAYSNRIKEQILGVSRDTLAQYTEYSEECAAQMAFGAMNAADADFGLSTTGVAGPSGGTDDIPVGTVFIGISDRRGFACGSVSRFDLIETPEHSARDFIRAAAAHKALELLLEHIQNY